MSVYCQLFFYSNGILGFINILSTKLSTPLIVRSIVMRIIANENFYYFANIEKIGIIIEYLRIIDTKTIILKNCKVEGSSIILDSIRIKSVKDILFENNNKKITVYTNNNRPDLNPIIIELDTP